MTIVALCFGSGVKCRNFDTGLSAATAIDAGVTTPYNEIRKSVTLRRYNLAASPAAGRHVKGEAAYGIMDGTFKGGGQAFGLSGGHFF